MQESPTHSGTVGRYAYAVTNFPFQSEDLGAATLAISTEPPDQNTADNQ